MQLEYMEVSLKGAGRRQVIGPFTVGLNAITGSRGSGKTRLVSWLRQMVSESGPTRPGLKDRVAGVSGMVELRNHGAKLHLVQSLDGQFSMRADSGPLSNRQRHAFDLLCAAGNSPDEVAALDDAAVRLGLDARPASGSLDPRDQLVSRERELVIRLEQVGSPTETREEIVNRRRDIEFRLNQIRQQLGANGTSLASDPQFRLDRYSAIDADLRGALAEVEQCDREIAEAKADRRLCEIGSQQVQVDQSYREQLQNLEDRLNRWRQTLRDIKNHRESMEFDETDARLDEQTCTQLSGTLYPDTRGAMRSLEAQLHNARKHLDQLVYQYASGNCGASVPWGMPSDCTTMPPVHGMQSTNATASNGQSLNGQSNWSGMHVQRDAQGKAHIELESRQIACASPTLVPEMLHSMQRDLHEVCHHLSRYEAQSAAEALKQQVQQLRRCERELLQSVEKLVEERARLLRKIADKYHLTSDQVTLTFGDWCQCNDHEHLYDWLLKDESTKHTGRRVDSHQRTRLEDALARLQSQRKEASLRAEECRRQLREIERGRPVASLQTADPVLRQTEVELLRELDAYQRLASDAEMRDKMRAELEEVRRQLAHLPQTPVTLSQYRESVNRHILGLSQNFYRFALNSQPDLRAVPWSETLNPSVAGSVVQPSNARRQVEVPRAILCTAQRLAIAQALATRGEDVPVILDQPFDGLSPDVQRSALDYLSLVAQRQQIIMLTEETQVADRIKDRRGNVLALSTILDTSRPDDDINRVLTSFANEHEADKWYRPSREPAPRPRTRQYYLSEYSQIEELPVIPQAAADRCHVLGIDIVGDLLDADPSWLASRMRLAKIGESTVRNWQSIAILLCSVRGLRPFDARVLVGSGIRNAKQLSSIHPTQLLDRVEQFLTTEIGQRILRSGNSYELSRISSWIAAAKSGVTRVHRNQKESQHREVDQDVDVRRRHSGMRKRDARLGEVEQTEASRSQAGRRRDRSGVPRDQYGLAGRQRRADRAHRNTLSTHFGKEPNAGAARTERTAVRSDDVHAKKNPGADRTQSGAAYRYYLELSSSVQDGPSIGERAAGRLNSQGIHTVEQLLKANPETVARMPGHRRNLML